MDAATQQIVFNDASERVDPETPLPPRKIVLRSESIPDFDTDGEDAGGEHQHQVLASASATASMCRPAAVAARDSGQGPREGQQKRSHAGHTALHPRPGLRNYCIRNTDPEAESSYVKI